MLKHGIGRGLRGTLISLAGVAVELITVAAVSLSFSMQPVETPDSTVDRVPVDQAVLAVSGQTVAVPDREVVAITRQPVTLTGQNQVPRDTEVVTARSIAFNGQMVAGLDIELVTQTVATVSGRTLTESDAVLVTNAAAAMTGQDVGTASAEVVAVTQAQATFTGRNLVEAERIAVTSRSVAFTGQNVNYVDPTSYTRPANPIIGEAQYVLHGREDLDYSARIYSDGRYYFETRQGERETWDGSDPLERSQWSSGEHPTGRHPTTWTSSSDSANTDYMIRSAFDWTPIQNTPGNANWSLIWEWHHVNAQTPTSYAPIRIGAQTVGANKPVYLFFGSYPSRATQDLGGAPNFVETQLIPTVQQGRTYHFEEEVNFHEVSGIYRLWLDGVKVFERVGVPVGYCRTYHYHEFGIYRATTSQISQVYFQFPDPNRIMKKGAIDGGSTGGGTTYHAIAQAYFDATSSTLSTAEKDSINTFVTDLVAAGIPLTGASSGIWLWNVTGLDAARRDLLHPTLQATLVGSVTHTPKVGITGDGTTGYYNTGSNFTAADDCLWMWAGTPDAGNPPMGDADYHNALGRFDGWSQCRISFATDDAWYTTPPGTAGGYISIQRNSATQVEGFGDSGTLGTAALNETTVSTGNALRFGAVAGQFSASQVKLGGKFAALLNPTQQAALRAAASAFVTRQAALA